MLTLLAVCLTINNLSKIIIKIVGELIIEGLVVGHETRHKRFQMINGLCSQIATMLKLGSHFCQAGLHGRLSTCLVQVMKQVLKVNCELIAVRKAFSPGKSSLVESNGPKVHKVDFEQPKPSSKF